MSFGFVLTSLSWFQKSKALPRWIIGIFLALEELQSGLSVRGRRQLSARNNEKKLINMEKATESLTLAQASQIVQEYQQVLQGVTTLLTLGAPVTLLPAPKDEIRQALRIMARTTDTGGLAGPTALDTLRTAYLSLANFLSYEEANAATRLQAAFDRGDRTYISSRAAVQTVARAQRIEEEAGVLAQEFDAFQKHNESDGLLSEIDALLADLDRKFTQTSTG